MSGPSLTAAEIAELVAGRLEGEAGGPFVRVQDLAVAGPSEVAWFSGAPDAMGRSPGTALLERLASSAAGLLLLDDAAGAAGRPCVRVADPALAAALVSRALQPARSFQAGVHPTAVVEDGAEVAADASIGPGCVVRAGARIGAGAALLANVHVGEGSVVGARCRLHPGVVLYERVELGVGCNVHAHVVLGAPGFGYVWDGARHLHVPQTGGVKIGAGVDIGAGSTIDAGTYAPTEVGDGCILDNQVVIGHNCRIGRAVVLCGMVGLAGSTIIEDGAVLGGRSGAVGHMTIGAGARLGGTAIATGDVEPGKTLAGNPAMEIGDYRRVQAMLRRMARDR